MQFLATFCTIFVLAQYIRNIFIRISKKIFVSNVNYYVPLSIVEAFHKFLMYLLKVKVNTYNYDYIIKVYVEGASVKLNKISIDDAERERRN